MQEPPDFSLMLGGPLFQLFLRAHLSGPALQLLKRRLLFVTGLSWLPLLVLAAIGGQLVGRESLPFLRDVETHVRFLVGIPVLVIAELIVHRRTRAAVKLFLERRIVREEEIPRFQSAVEAALRLRNSIPLELALVVFVYTAGHWIWLHSVALGTASWYGVPVGNSLRLTLPGYWYAFVSIPIGQFLLFRWYLRLVIWFRLMWRVSRLNLKLLPTHPDRAGGIGFLARSCVGFSPILFAQGAALAGIIANRILYAGQNLMSFRWTIAALAAFALLVVLGPLTVFTPNLYFARRDGLREYGTLATSYTEDFDKKWLRGGARNEAILGTADIQSLADLDNSFAVIQKMRWVPFSYNHAMVLVVATVLPLLPLLLTIMPIEELIQRLVKIIF